MSNIAEAPVQAEPVVVKSVPSTFNANDAITEVESFFGVQVGINNDVRNRLQTIIEVASHEAKSTGDVMKNIKEMQRKVGAAYYGSEAINRIYNYAKLKLNRIELQKKIEAYEVDHGIS